MVNKNSWFPTSLLSGGAEEPMFPSVSMESHPGKLETESENSDNISKLRQALLKLDDRSKDIIQQRYLLDNKSTLDDLSKKYNISKERVRQIENKSLDLIKDSILIA